MRDYEDLPLFRHPEPETEKAIKRADEHADQEWKDAALEKVYQIARKQEILTADDLNDAIAGDKDMPAGYHAPGATGPVMRRARKQGWIELCDGVHAESRRSAAHRRPQRVWRSKIYGEVVNATSRE